MPVLHIGIGTFTNEVLYHVDATMTESDMQECIELFDTR